MKFEEILKELSVIKDFVIVGGAAEVFHGKKAATKDIDIVTTNLKPFRYLGETRCWETPSLFSKSGKRAFVTRPDYSVDIFIEEEFPLYVVDEKTGLKYETLESIINFYKTLYYTYDPLKQWKQREFVMKKHNAISDYPLDPLAIFPPNLGT